jgi:hypothetical protein
MRLRIGESGTKEGLDGGLDGGLVVEGEFVLSNMVGDEFDIGVNCCGDEPSSLAGKD